MTKRLLAMTLLSLSSIVAQERAPGNLILPVIRQQWDELKQHLVLSDAQVSTLEQILKNRTDAEQTIYRQITEKQQQIYALLEQGSNDAATIGRLTVESNNLRRQLPLNSGPYRTQALAVLNDAQKGKLTNLNEALKLQTPGWQAVQLNLIDNPSIPDIRILPYPVSASETAISSNVTRVLR